MNGVIMGCKARDRVTGLEGITTGFASYLYGCNQWAITPPAKDGDSRATVWFDEGRVEYVDVGVSPESVRAAENGAGDAPTSAHGRLG